MAPFLPGPIVDIVQEPLSDEDMPDYGFVLPPKSIGRVKAFYGNFGMVVRAYAYMLVYGGEGLRHVSEMAVLNANYIRVKLHDTYHVPYDRINMHEFVAEGVFEDAPGIHALDISKRLMDYGIHPPTNYFPLIVHEALMIEPTETECKEDIDEFIKAMKSIAEEAHQNPELLHAAPVITKVERLDETGAARNPCLTG